MRGLKRIGVLLALTLVVAASEANAETVLAAEEVVAEAAATEEVNETVEEAATTEEVKETVEEVTTTEEVKESVEEVTTTEEVKETVEEVVTTEDVAEDVAITEDVVDEAAISTYSLRAASLDASATTELQEASAYTTWTSKNYYDGEELKDEVRLEGEEGDILSTIFKINFKGAKTTSFVDDEDLTSYCTNLPAGLILKKYTDNNSVRFMRVELEGTAKAGNYDVTVTVPTEKLVAQEGYVIPEKGISVTIYLTVNGEKIPVTIPVEETSADHEHSYSWQTLKQATATEDGLEAYMCGCGDIEATRVISAYGLWLESVKKEILTAEENAVVEIKTDVWNTYNKSVMDALSERTDVTLVTTFGKDDEAVTFTIPAGGSNVIVEEATALAASVDDANGTAATGTEEEAQWYGFGFLSGRYAN